MTSIRVPDRKVRELRQQGATVEDAVDLYLGMLNPEETLSHIREDSQL